MKTTYLLFVACTLIGSALSLSCYCDKKSCPKPNCPKGGIVKDACGCCDVCAKQLGQRCGGLFDLAGRCDKGLACVVRKHGIIVKRDNMRHGHCEPAACRSLSCPKYFSCSLVNNNPTCECPRHCKKTGQKVCDLATGQEYDNECELKRYECKKNIKIQYKNGPCKRCVLNGQRYKFGEQVTIGNCKLCSCAHGAWKCKTFCSKQSTKHLQLTSSILEDKKACPIMQCKPCRHGFMSDENGCNTCVCKPKRNVCTLPKNPGKSCDQLENRQYIRFFFNQKSGKCESFVFKGCKPNSNNFKTKKACIAACLA